METLANYLTVMNPTIELPELFDNLVATLPKIVDLIDNAIPVKENHAFSVSFMYYNFMFYVLQSSYYYNLYIFVHL